MSKPTNEILFLGTEFTSGKGGIASVLKEYKNIFPNAHFVPTTSSGNILNNLKYLFRGLLFTIFFLAKKDVKIVHIHGASYHSFYRKYIFFKLSQLFGKAVIYHVHGAEYHLFYENSNKYTKYLIQDFINNADCIICLSNRWKMFFENTFRPRKVEVVKNIVPIISDLNTTSSSVLPLKFLFLGHISERKGIWLLLETIKENKKEFLGTALFHIGGNGETERLKSLIKKFEVEKIVEFIGWVSSEKKEKYLRESDVFILPSYNEGLPISVLEAMSYQLPILSTPVGGIPEVVEDGKNGILIEPGNKKSLTAAIRFMVNNPSFRNMAANISYEKVQPHFPEQVKEQLNLIYQELLQ